MNREDALAFLEDMGRELLRQDNLGTSDPVWLVETQEKLYGVDPAWADADGSAMLDGNGEVDPEGEAVHYMTQRLLNGPASLTRRGIEDYIAADGHNLERPRPYAASLYRCEEMQKLRRALIALAKEKP